MALLLPILNEHQSLLDTFFGRGDDDGVLKLKLSSENFLSPLLPKTARRQHLHPYNKSLKRSSSSSSSSEKDFSVSLDVQQFSPEEITVKIVNDDTVMIECKHEEKEDEHGSIFRHFIRRYEVPKGFDVLKCSSKLSNDGVLTVTVPKLKNAAVGKNEINIPIKFTNQPTEIPEKVKVAEGENAEK